MESGVLRQDPSGADDILEFIFEPLYLTLVRGREMLDTTDH